MDRMIVYAWMGGWMDRQVYGSINNGWIFLWISSQTVYSTTLILQYSFCISFYIKANQVKLRYCTENTQPKETNKSLSITWNMSKWRGWWHEGLVPQMQRTADLISARVIRHLHDSAVWGRTFTRTETGWMGTWLVGWMGWWAGRWMAGWMSGM